jgi:hypothetical protein
MNKCILCGEILNENGICPNSAQHFKPMCLNCEYCQYTEQHCLCMNDENREDAINRIKASFEGGYEVKDVILEPLPLKEPTKKCKRYNPNNTLILNTLIGNK